MSHDLALVLLGLSLFFITCQFLGIWIDRKLDRAAEQIAEKDRDWRRELPDAWKTPATRDLDEAA